MPPNALQRSGPSNGSPGTKRLRTRLAARANCSAGPPAHNTTDAPLSVFLYTPTPKISPKDPFTLYVGLVNNGEEDISVFGQLRWGHAGGLVLTIRDQDGRLVEPERLDDDLIVPSVLRQSTSYTVLPPDHFIGTVRRDSTSNLFRKLGTFSLVVEYRSPVPARYAKTPNFWSRERGVIRSEAIQIEVTEHRAQSSGVQNRRSTADKRPL